MGDVNPGSKEAQEEGCICSPLDNNYGDGMMVGGGSLYWINEQCPLHNPEFE